MSSSHGHSIRTTGIGYEAACIYNYSSIIRSKAKQISLSLQFHLSISCSLSLLVPTPLSCPLLFFNQNTLFFLKRSSITYFMLCASFLSLRRVGAPLRCGAQASYCGGFSCYEAWALGAWTSVAVACGLSSCSSWALEHRLSSRGARAELPYRMGNLPGTGIEPVSLALAGGLLSTVPPGKSNILHY